MASLAISGLRDRPAATGKALLDGIDLSVGHGERHALVMAAGAGKSLLAALLTGEARPAAGSIRLGDRDVSGVPPGERGIAFLPTVPVVYPGLTVADNLALPLRGRDVAPAIVRERTGALASSLGLEPCLLRKAEELDPLERQLAALGRVLARPSSELILLDDPTRALPKNQRHIVRQRLVRSLADQRVTMLVLTSDPTEATALATHLSFVEAGKVLHTGAVDDLFDRPPHKLIAARLNRFGINVITCHLTRDGLGIDGTDLLLGDPWASLAARHPRARLELMIRPEDLLLETEDAGGVPVVIERVQYLGGYNLVTCILGPHRLRIRLDEADPLPVGRGFVSFHPERTYLYVDDRLVR